VNKKYFKNLLPNHEKIKKNRWVRPFGTWLKHPNLWHLHRRSVSGGVAVGLFCGLIPGPFQMLGAGLLAVLFRVNLPVALFSTLYTNPFTIVPLYFIAYEYGSLLTGRGHTLTSVQLVVPDMNLSNWFGVMIEWIISLGKPFIVGLPLLAITLAVVGYLSVRVGWRIWVMWQWHQHGKRPKSKCL